jgi:hypothetical protein
MTLLEAMRDPNLFARWFRDPETWTTWRAFISSLFALPMTGVLLANYRQCTARTHPPAAPVTEAWLVCGRRSGNSFVLALIAVFLACFHEWRRHLAPGERGTVMIVAADRKQARVILRYSRGLLNGVPMLARLIERETAEAFDLSNSISIEVGTASFRTVRGYTIVAALLDELAFWPTTDDSANPDYEVINAIRPGMATVPGAMLLCASSPYDPPGRAVGRDGAREGRRPSGLAGHARDEPDRPQRVIDERPSATRPMPQPSSAPSSGATSRASSVSRRCTPASSPRAYLSGHRCEMRFTKHLWTPLAAAPTV